MKPIGYIDSCFQEKFATPRQGVLSPSSRARLNLCPQTVGEGALEGLKSPGFVWLIWRFHSSSRQVKGKIKPPRLGGKKLGVFASRSPHRPNPMGLSLVKVESVGPTWLDLSGIDLIDGTAVLDIKPYIADYDSPPRGEQLQVLTSTELAPLKALRVSVADSVRLQLQSWHSEGGISHPADLLLQTVCESLSLDPRPLAYRRPSARSGQMKQDFVCRIFSIDWHFRYLNEEEIEVFRAVQKP